MASTTLFQVANLQATCDKLREGPSTAHIPVLKLLSKEPDGFRLGFRSKFFWFCYHMLKAREISKPGQVRSAVSSFARFYSAFKEKVAKGGNICLIVNPNTGHSDLLWQKGKPDLWHLIDPSTGLIPVEKADALLTLVSPSSSNPRLSKIIMRFANFCNTHIILEDFAGNLKNHEISKESFVAIANMFILMSKAIPLDTTTKKQTVHIRLSFKPETYRFSLTANGLFKGGPHTNYINAQNSMLLRPLRWTSGAVFRATTSLVAHGCTLFSLNLSDSLPAAIDLSHAYILADG